MQRDDLILMLDLHTEVSVLCCERSDPLLVHGVLDAQLVPLGFQPLVFRRCRQDEKRRKRGGDDGDGQAYKQ